MDGNGFELEFWSVLVESEESVRSWDTALVCFLFLWWLAASSAASACSVRFRLGMVVAHIAEQPDSRRMHVSTPSHQSKGKVITC